MIRIFLDTCTAVSASGYVESPALTTTISLRNLLSGIERIQFYYLKHWLQCWINWIRIKKLKLCEQVFIESPYIAAATVATSAGSNGATSTWTISIPLSNKIPAYGKINLTFKPLTSSYTSYATAQQVLSTSSTFTCKYASVIFLFQLLKATTSCSSSKLAVSTSQSSVLITFSSSVLAAGGTLQLLVANAKNPLSSQPYTGLTMISYENSNLIDTYTLQTGVSTSSASQSGTTSNIYNSKTLIKDTNAEYFFQFTTINPIPSSGFLQITVGSGITLPASFSSWVFKAYDTEVSGASFSASGQVLTVKNIISTYLKGGTDYQFSITGWTNPIDTTAVSFSIVTAEATSGTTYSIDTFSGFQIQAALGAIYVLSLKPTDDSRMLLFPTNYTIQIQCKTSIASTDYLEIIFPSEFDVADSSSCKISGFYQTSTTCTSSSSSRTITIKKLSTSAISSMNTITFTVNSIRNPAIYDKSNQIIFNHKTSIGVIQDSGKYYVPKNTYTQSYINTFKVTPGTTQAGGKVISYQFSISPAAYIPKGALIAIYLPEEVTINSASNIEFSCGGTLSGFTSSPLLCQVKSSNKIVIQKGFTSAKSVNDPPTISFTIPSLNNPRSLEPSKIFGAQILDSSSRVIYAWNNTETPYATMKTSGVPSKFLLSRTSTQNSNLTNYIFNITPSLYYQDNDVIKIVAPSPIVFTNSSSCKGLVSLASTLTCKKSTDFKSIEIKLSTSRMRYLAQIASGSLISIQVSNVQNSVSTKMTSSGFAVYAQTSNGYVIESSTTGPYVVNTEAAVLNSQKANVQPSNYIENKSAVYQFQFVTTGFQQNMRIKITLPTQINFIGTSLKCRGIHGVDKQNLTCIINSADKSFSISDALTNQEIAPNNITFSVDSLLNPTKRELTSSFKIETFTNDSYAIDKLTADLALDFFCVYPCKTCNQSNSSQCFSCYSFVSEKYFFQDQCFEDCPAGYFNRDNNTCGKCNSPCAKCKSTADLCTSCIDLYVLGGNGQCYEKVIIANLYPFPFSVFAVFATFSAWITKCFAKKTKFLQSAIALCAFPEMIAWISATFMLSQFGMAFSAFLVFIGIAIHILMNFTYCLLHQRIFLRRSDQKYLDFFRTHNNCNRITLVVSFVFSFKFHMISLSHCANGEHLKGSWNKFQWLLWNAIVLLYIILSLAPMVFGCIHEILMAPEKMFTFTWYITLDCIIVTIYMAILLIILLIRYAPCIISRRKNKALLYNRVENENSLLNDDQNQHTKLNIQKLNELDKEKFERQIETDEGDAKTRRRDTQQNEEQAEIEQLQNFIKQLEKESLIIEQDERKDIIDERSKILKEEEDKLLEKQPEELRDVKKDFLNQVDKRVSLKIEPWEIEQPTPEPEPIILPRINPVSESVYNYYEQLFSNERGIKLPKASFENLKQDERSGFKNEIGGQILPKKRIFEKVEYEIQENDQQETDDDLDEIEMKDEVADDVKLRNNVLYSDKSESSIDDMMEDTPSNYNIPNGRLDGKSLGLKALLLQAKKQGIKLDVEKTGTGLKLAGNNNILTKPPRVKEEEEKKFINNLFRNSNDLNQATGRSNNLNTNNSLKHDSLEHTGNMNENSTLEIMEKNQKKKKKVQNQKQFKESPEQDKIKGMISKNATQDLDANKKSSKMLSKSPVKNNNEDIGKVKANNFF
ncbi:UNKNOWN [Stylonychia lemnae]|uniref:Uncharacterized protein n=1 Tax=Stylonychia lemnae TaxID=5949 RepID=A0A077ZPM5_STYLE|nr:UNKNOWN [Stylonychia lemnae]|eukprot:CDW71848.1 UNKNOWN [Stylonychia lemnae]